MARSPITSPFAQPPSLDTEATAPTAAGTSRVAHIVNLAADPACGPVRYWTGGTLPGHTGTPLAVYTLMHEHAARFSSAEAARAAAEMAMLPGPFTVEEHAWDA